MSGSPCPCRGCMAAYKAGYTDGHNEAIALSQNLDIADWVYGKGYDPDAKDNRP